MIKKNNQKERAEERELVITRVFDAPRDLVFKAWTERDRMMRWWGPNGFTLPVCNLDVRPGGAAGRGSRCSTLLSNRARIGTCAGRAGTNRWSSSKTTWRRDGPLPNAHRPEP